MPFSRRRYLRKTVTVSFEEDRVSILHAYLKGRNLFIEKTETIANDQLDSYLKNEKANEFLVVCDFNESFHELVALPFVKTRLLRNIIEAEIRKTIGIKELSFIYTCIGERIAENKKITDAFYYAVKDEEIRNILRVFYDNGKTVKAIYPRVFSAAPLFETRDMAVIGIMGTKTEKMAFLLKKENIYFIRKFQSQTPDISDVDIQYINMTINYCFQNVRINPTLVLVVGNLSRGKDTTTFASVPLEPLPKPDFIDAEEEVFRDSVCSISSVYAHKSSNILSREFGNVNILKRYLLNASRFFVLLSLMCLAVMLYDVEDIIYTKEILRITGGSTANTDKVLSEYSVKEEEFMKYMPVVNFLNMPAADARELLIALAKIDMGNLTLDSIVVTAKDDFFSVALNGTAYSDSYSSIHEGFQAIMNSLEKTGGIENMDKTIDIEKKTFSVTMDYRIKK